MNQKTLLDELVKILKLIIAHPRAIVELISLVAESGCEAQILKVLLVRIQTLIQLGVLATKAKEFEPIGDGLYSMHVTGRGFNLRILYSFLPDRSPALLLSFYEREGKRRTDYTTQKEPAKSRLKELLEENKNGQ